MEKIEATGISKSFGEVQAVRNLSFRVEEGTIYGILGVNGSGKTTTIRMLLNILTPDQGEILINGRPFDEELKNRIGYLPEERGLYRKMKVRDLLCYMGELKGLTSAQANKKASYWVERVGLSEWMDKKAEELSKGMQQKIQFVSALIHDPEIVILDEPFSGLDPINTVTLLEVMEEVKKRGAAVLFSTHILEHAEKLVDKLTFIRQGQNVLTGTMGEVKGRFAATIFRIRIDGEGSLLSSLPKVLKVQAFGHEYEVETEGDTEPTEFLKNLLTAGLRVEKFEKVEPSLTNIYMKVMRGEDGKN